MTQYRLDFLNDSEFEILVCDLLGSAFGVRVESFKPGRDRGVDGRFYLEGGGECILQCKHWEKSGLSKLKKHLEQDELPKVRRLTPARYILVTSVPLSRDDKSEIARLFSPFVLRDDDIYGSQDVQHLLMLHPKVVEGHYKLWFSSTEVMRLITSAAIIGRSKFTLREAHADMPKYVFTADYAKAIEKLEELKAIVITGEPGIGKTTLAKQLLLFYASQEFEIVHITGDLSEAESVLGDEKKQLFYFDDFLGTNYLQFFQGRTDSRVMEFLVRICRSTNKRFVLTSRTTILNRAKAISEAIHHFSLSRREFEVQAGNFRPLEKARILYNHLWHSSISEQHIAEIFREKRYRRVIEHRNYNPRIIEFVTDAQRIADMPAANYWAYVLGNLENPADIWKGVYEAQLDSDSRWILCAVVFNGGTFIENEIKERYFATFGGGDPGDAVELEMRFNGALGLACGSVLTRTMDVERKTVRLTPFNPSISDYVIMRLSAETTTVASLLSSLQTTESIRNLKMLVHWKHVSNGAFRTIMEHIIKVCANTLVKDGFRLAVAGVLLSEQWEEPPYSEFLGQCLQRANELLEYAQYDPKSFEALLSLISYGVRNDWFDEDSERLVDMLEVIMEEDLDLDDYASVSAVLDQMGQVGNESLYAKFWRNVYDRLERSIDEMVEEREVIADIVDDEERHFARRQIVSFVDGLLDDFYIPRVGNIAEGVADSCDVAGIIERNREASESWVKLRPGQDREALVGDDAEIDDLFGRIKIVHT